MSEPIGVVEVIRRDLRGPVVRVRHRRTSGDSWWMRFACAETGEGIVAPFDDPDASPCAKCFPAVPPGVGESE